MIRLSEVLKKKFPDSDFIPVYWMASEDHDFDEIQFFNYRNKRFTWESSQGGAVGEFSLDAFNDYADTLPFSTEEIKACYTKSKSLGEAHLKLVDMLFREYGLVVIDAHSKKLKEIFAEYVKRDCDDLITKNHVSDTNEKIQDFGYSTQVNPRDLNYFILGNGSRDRLEIENGNCFYQDSKGNREELDLAELIETQPEKISPNVITRPLYQEIILPNLAYIGGPAELSYWMQLKSSFDQLEVNFPILLPRFSATVLSRKSINKLEKSGIKDLTLFFIEERELLKQVMITNGLIDVDKHSEWEEGVNKLFDAINAEVSAIDMTLGPSAEGRRQKVLKELSRIRKKMESAVIRQQGVHKERVYALREEIFPKGVFQERFMNIIELLEEDSDTIDQLYSAFEDPLNLKHILIERT